MSVLDRPELVPVPLGYCPCEGTPHEDGDTVYLYPELSTPGGMAAQGAISAASGDGGIDEVRLQELLAMVWVRHGVAAWTFVDDDGRDIPVNTANILAALPYGKGGRLIADKADDLYAEAVTAPLVERFAALSKRGPTRTPSPTSPKRTTPSKPPKRSSTATTDKVLPAG